MGAYETVANFMASDGISSVVDTIASNVGKMGDKFSESMQSMGGAATAMSGAVGAGIGIVAALAAEGVNHFLEVTDSMGKMAARTDALPETLGKYKDAAEKLFKTGLVKNFSDAAAAVENLQKKVHGLGDTNMDEFLRQAAGVGAAWDVPASQVVDSVSRMQKKFVELADDPFKALDLLTKTAQDSTLPLDKINAIVEKYGEKFHAAGISAQGMGGLIVEGARAGLDTTKGIGALSATLDTFHEKLMNPPSSVKAALKDLGLGNVAKDLKDNKITMDQALDEVLTHLAALPDGPNKANDAVALFGPSVGKMISVDTLTKFAGFTDALGGDKGIAGAAKKAADKINELPETSFQKLKNGIDDALGKMVEAASADIIKTTDVLSAGWKLINGDLKAATPDMVKAAVAYTQPLATQLKGLLDTINAILLGLAKIAGNAGPNGPGNNFRGPGGGAGAHAWGGTLDRGWNIIGERGPEMVNRESGEVLTNRETNTTLNMIMAGAVASSGNGGGNVHFHMDNATVVDMAAFVRQVYTLIQAEDARRGKRS